MNRSESTKQLMAELTAITGLGASSVNLDTMQVIDSAQPGKASDTHYCPGCPFFGMESCIPYWLKQPDENDMLYCPDGLAFAHARLMERDLLSGVILLGPLPQGLLKNQVRLNSLNTLLEAFALLMEKRGLMPPRNDAYSAISRYVSAHLTDDLSLETLQAELYLSASTISRTVKKESGLPLRLYIQSRRLEAARRLLLTTSMTVIQIAEQCGINDFNYFSRIFKKHYGMSPTAMRAQSMDKSN